LDDHHRIKQYMHKYSCYYDYYPSIHINTTPQQEQPQQYF